MVTCLGLLLGFAAPATGAAAAAPYVKDLGWGMAAIGTNIFYIPAKMLYATGGGIVGALALGLTLGNLEAAQHIWSPTVGGTWVLTPEMMRGQKPVLFSGESFEPRQ
jgi:hypothetical protein